MSAEQTIWGLRVYLDTIETENTDIGLYTAATSELRWIEAPVSGTAVTWKSGILIPNGISPIREEADLSQGGNIATVKPMTITIDDTSQFWKTIEDIGVYLNGLRAEVWEFVYDYGTSTLTSESALHRGALTVDRWGVQQYRIGLEYPQHKRRANIVQNVNSADHPNAGSDEIGKSIPCTFGKWDHKPAKFQKIASKETTMPASTFCTATDAGLTTTEFPVLDEAESPHAVPTTQYEIGLGTLGNVTQTPGAIVNPEDYYLYVVEDDNEEGKYRRITEYGPHNANSMYVIIDAPFENDLNYDSNGDGAWVQIIEVKNEYAVDAWPCKDFLDDDGNAIDISTDERLSLFAYDSDQKIDTKVDVSGAAETVAITAPVLESTPSVIRLPSFGYTDSGNGDKNQVDINATLFENNTSTMRSFMIMPVASVNYVDSVAEADTWAGESTQIIANGWFQSTYHSVGVTVSNQSGATSNLNDRDHTTLLHDRIVFDASPKAARHYYMLKIGLPEYPTDFDFDEAYVVMLTDVSHSAYGPSGTVDIGVKWRRWMGTAESVRVSSGSSNYNGISQDNIIDGYWSSSRDTDDEFFYYEQDNVLASGKYNDSGYALFELPSVKTPEQYSRVRELVWYVLWSCGTGHQTEVKPYEFAILFRKKVSTRRGIYSYMDGRIYNDTWGARKTAADMITDYVDVYEHVSRLQNWSDAGDTAVSYGKEYSASALINTGSGDGGLGNSRLSTPREYDVAWQILKYADGWTDKIKRRLCKLMWCVGYVDESGQECLAYMPHTEDSVTDSITLSDMPDDMPPGDVEEPEPSTIYCEPFVRYAYNPASGEYDGYIGVNNVHNGTWETAFTPGFSPAEGEEIYDIIHENLWDRYRFIEEPPSDLTDRPEIKTADDAKRYLRIRVAWMLGKRISVSVYYGLAKTWHVGRHVNLTLPHQTNGVAKECVVESITKDKNRGVCTMKLIILDTNTIDIGDFYIQKVLYTAAEGAGGDWEKTTQDGDTEREKVL